MAVREITRHFIKLHLIPRKNHSTLQMSTSRMEEEASIQGISHSNPKDGLFWTPVAKRHTGSSISPTHLLSFAFWFITKQLGQLSAKYSSFSYTKATV